MPTRAYPIYTYINNATVIYCENLGGRWISTCVCALTNTDENVSNVYNNGRGYFFFFFFMLTGIMREG